MSVQVQKVGNCTPLPVTVLRMEECEGGSPGRDLFRCRCTRGGCRGKAAAGMLAELSGHLTLPGLTSSPVGAGLPGAAGRQAGFSSSLSSANAGWVRVCVLSHVQLLTTPWTVTLQAPLSMKFSRQEYRSGLPFPTPGDLLDLETEPVSPALAGRFFTTTSEASSILTLFSL